MKYKVGQKVRIKSLDWYNKNKNNRNEITFENNPHWRFVANQSEHCGQIATITSVSKTAYRFENIPWNWTDEMIEGLVEEEVDLIPKFGEFSDNEPLDIPTMTTDFIKEHGFPCPNGYIFKDENGNVINATKIVLEKKKKEYPKTYEECFNICYPNKHHIIQVVGLNDSETKLFEAFIKLKICRDAYWKIAGEEMGLGRSWVPNWTSFEGYPAIYMYRYQITLSVAKDVHHCLVFPTEEMQDAFYENFKELIEQCKELL